MIFNVVNSHLYIKSDFYFIYHLYVFIGKGQPDIKSEGGDREGKRQRDTCHTALPLTKFPPAGKNQGLEPRSLYTGICVLSQVCHHPFS